MSDADLVLGYLDPAYFAGGRIALDDDAARRAVAEHVARPLGLPVEEAAAGIYRVVNESMAHGVRRITAERGLDPREFPMVVAGGAGPLHACGIARALEIPVVVVPPVASVLCAAGMLQADLAHDLARSCLAPLGGIDAARLRGLVADMQAQGEALLRSEGVEPAHVAHEVALDLRYRKQYHEVAVPVPREALAGDDRAAITRAFHAAHDRLYGYELSAERTPVEIINVRVRSVGRTAKPDLARVERGGVAPPPGARRETRRAYLPARGDFAEVPVWDGHRLLAGNAVDGPALIERVDTTIFVDDGWRASIDEHGTCVLRSGE